jgi:hypothetical protein
MSASTAHAPRAAMPGHGTRPTATIWIAYGVMGILLAGYLARLLFHGEHYWPLVDGWGVAGFELIVSGLCLARPANELTFLQRATSGNGSVAALPRQQDPVHDRPLQKAASAGAR